MKGAAVKRYANVTSATLESTMAEAAAYAEEHRDEQVEIHLVGDTHTLTGSMPMIPANVTIIGPER